MDLFGKFEDLFQDVPVGKDMQECVRSLKLLNLIVERCQKCFSAQVVVFPGEFFPGTLINGFLPK